MDATVDDFLKEINQISPKKDTKQTDIAVWQECYDELTGYSYYWNTVTDEVTWEQPESFNAFTSDAKKPEIPEKKQTESFIPPSAPLILSTNVSPEAKVKIYSIQENLLKETNKKSVPTLASTQNPQRKGPPKSLNESDDEKIELITSYGDDSDSEREETTSQINNVSIDMKQDESQSDEDDDIDILAKIQKRAKELQKLGGDIPLEVKNIIKNVPLNDKLEKPKDISGYSLVAGYNSESESEDDQESTTVATIPKPIFSVPDATNPVPETSHSTLFPITEPIDVKDFIGPNEHPPEIVKKDENGSSAFDTKAFQRKRRIGVSLVNSAKKPKEGNICEEERDSLFKGFGFKCEQDYTNDDVPKPELKENRYAGFQRGGVMFIKSDVVNPSELNVEKQGSEMVQKEGGINRKETEDIYTLLREKLMYLGEGRAPMLPVQMMLIQAETLFLAMIEEGLTPSYLDKWLRQTCSELIQLEEEAAPEGWLLQWDRSHKRYFYQNRATGQSQWEFPLPEMTQCDDEMDISTTPPPPVEPEPPLRPPLPPSPPSISSPTPPPPPMISGDDQGALGFPDFPLPQEHVQPSQKIPEDDEPLPPGVDMPEIASSYKALPEEAQPPDSMSSVLNSFYSEIAEVSENRISNSPLPTPALPDVNIDMPEVVQSHLINAGESVKKKKKRVKLAQGLTMKKKGVSELVEKWKNVQKNFGD